MRFVHDDLKNNAEKNNDRRFRLAWFDAWKYEKEDALWRALLLRVVDNLREFDEQGEEKTGKELRDKIDKLEESLYREVQWEDKGGIQVDWPKAAGAVAGTAVRLSVSMLPGFAVKAVEAAQSALGGGKDLENLLGAFQRESVKHHQAQLRSIEQFQKEFGDLVDHYIFKKNERLVVFIDDLDRCLPEKAIEVLEAIKLFLDVKGCIFLLGVEQGVIEQGIKYKYAGKAVGIDGGQYLEKIIQLPFRLPKIEPSSMKPFVHGLAAFSDERCEEVFAEGLETNPRRVKRAVNVFLFISKLADKRGIPIGQVRLAKIVVIYHSYPQLYEQLRNNPARLRDLEAYLRKQNEQTRPMERDARTPDQSAERAAEEKETAPAEAQWVDDSLKHVLTMFLDDDAACFLKADYDELNSYFTLTRGAVAQVPTDSTVSSGSVARVQLAFPAPAFITIPAGEFLMGTSDAEIELLLKMKETKDWAAKWKKDGSFNPEQPQHRVFLDGYQIAKYPVTNAEYQAFVQATNRQSPKHWSGGTFPEELAAHPVVYVNWEDAAEYCKWLTEQLRKANQLSENYAIRLPTEAEWEKAAAWDDGKKLHRIYPWGNEWDTAKCNSAEGKVGATTPVGKYSTAGDSFYGLADMAGNVWEWCADWYDENYYKASPEKNPQGADSTSYRVLRGGSWGSDAGYARCAHRFRDVPGDWDVFRGFRCARGSPS